MSDLFAFLRQPCSKWMPRIGLRIQIALLGLLRVGAIGAICLAGLHFDARAQAEADRALTLRHEVAGLATGYLEAGQIANAFMRTREERKSPAMSSTRRRR